MFICSKCGSENWPSISHYEPAQERGKIWITCRECGDYGLHAYEGARRLDLHQLKSLGLAVVDTLVGGVTGGIEAAKSVFGGFVVRPIPEGESEQYYVSLIAKLAGVKLTEEEAEDAWRSVLDHKWYLSEKAGRDVGIEVAAMDFFKNIWQQKCAGKGKAPGAGST